MFKKIGKQNEQCDNSETIGNKWYIESYQNQVKTKIIRIRIIK